MCLVTANHQHSVIIVLDEALFSTKKYLSQYMIRPTIRPVSPAKTDQPSQDLDQPVHPLSTARVYFPIFLYGVRPSVNFFVSG